MSVILFGWTMEEWARAAAWHQSTIGPVEPSHVGALTIRREWLQRYSHKPGEVKFEGVAPAMDHEWACNLQLHPRIAEYALYLGPQP